MEDKGEEAGAGREPSDHDAAPTPGKEVREERRLDGKNPRLESSFKKGLARLMAVMELKEPVLGVPSLTGRGQHQFPAVPGFREGF